MGSAIALPMAACRQTSAPPASGSAPAGAAAGSAPGASSGAAGTLRWPRPIGSPVLDSLRPVIEGSRHVKTDVAKIGEVAKWMAFEELPFPQFSLPFGLERDRDQAIDFTMVSNCTNSAFTDFSTNVKFQAEYQGQNWSDSQAMTACLKRAIDQGTPVLKSKS